MSEACSALIAEVVRDDTLWMLGAYFAGLATAALVGLCEWEPKR
jgi:hypothetical protein